MSGRRWGGDPFDLWQDVPYQRWREFKLRIAPVGPADLLVEVRDLAAPTDAEADALLHRCRLANMAVYAAPPADKAAQRAFAARFGLIRLDANTLADADGITPLLVAPEGARRRYIPYTDRPISWHTDGYYNAMEAQVRAMVLHCACPAASGGENLLLDHELAYILLRDADPDHIAALSRPDAMTIPANGEDGVDRPDSSGPVFCVLGGSLHMRYTARPRNVVWHPDTAAALAALKDILATSPHVLRHRLEAGQGYLCNNVLHTREPFTDDPDRPRLLYRARYLDRIAGT